VAPKAHQPRRACWSRAGGAQALGELADRCRHFIAVGVRRRDQIETDVGERGRHQRRIVGRIGQRRNGRIGRVADDQRNALLGSSGAAELRSRSDSVAHTRMRQYAITVPRMPLAVEEVGFLR